MGLIYRAVALPALFLVVAFGLGRAAQSAAANVYLQGLVTPLAYAEQGCVVFALLLILYALLRVWWAWSGRDDDACHQCSMPTTYHARGRYGPYYKCWGCGTNRADRNGW